MALRGAPFATLKSFFLHKYYFELMATTTQKIKEKFFTSLMPDFTSEIGWYQEEIYYLKYLSTMKLIYITRQTLFFEYLLPSNHVPPPCTQTPVALAQNIAPALIPWMSFGSHIFMGLPHIHI